MVCCTEAAVQWDVQRRRKDAKQFEQYERIKRFKWQCGRYYLLRIRNFIATRCQNQLMSFPFIVTHRFQIRLHQNGKGYYFPTAFTVAEVGLLIGHSPSEPGVLPFGTCTATSRIDVTRRFCHSFCGHFINLFPDRFSINQPPKFHGFIHGLTLPSG